MGETSTAGFNGYMGFELLGERDGEFEVALEVRPHHLHEAGRVHGGVYLALLDTAMARASRALLGPHEYLPTLELKMNFLGSIASGRLFARGRVVLRTKQTCYVEGTIVADTGRLIARGSATMIVLTQ